jgi:hypothetical protein
LTTVASTRSIPSSVNYVTVTSGTAVSVAAHKTFVDVAD